MSVVDEQTVIIKCDAPACLSISARIPKDRVQGAREWLREHDGWTGDDTHDWCGWHPRFNAARAAQTGAPDA